MVRHSSDHEEALLKKVRPYFAYKDGKVQLVDAPEEAVNAYNELLMLEQQRNENAAEIL